MDKEGIVIFFIVVATNGNRWTRIRCGPKARERRHGNY